MNRQHLLLWLLFTVPALVLACTGRAGSPTPLLATPAPTTTPTPISSPEAFAPSPDTKAIDGGTFIRLGNDPPTLDPHLAGDATSAIYIVEIFGGLVTITPDLRIVPDLAKSWDTSNDGRTYTFHLRPDARFHNGKPVTAQDFKWSMERAADPRTESFVVDTYLRDIVGVRDKLNGLATEIRGIRVIDDHTLEITIDAPKASFLAKLTYPTSFVLDRENVESGRQWVTKPNGTGPFKLAAYVPGEELVLEKNEDFHLDPAKLARVQFILSDGSSMLMYENDEIHITGVGIADLDRILDPASPLNKQLNIAPPDFSTSYMGMNSQTPPFDDPKVRQSLNYAIDRESIARGVLRALVIPAKGILPPGFPAYDSNRKGYDYDPEKARQLLQASKYGSDLDNFPRIILTVPGAFGATVGLDTEAILEMWRQNLGIEVEIQQTEWATFLQDLNQLRFQIFGGLSWIADYPDPENFLDLLFHTASGINQTAYSNREVDRLLENARVEQDQGVRYELYRRVEELILQDAPWVFLWHESEGHVLLKPNVRDYFLTQLVVPKLRFVYFVEQ